MKTVEQSLLDNLNEELFKKAIQNLKDHYNKSNKSAEYILKSDCENILEALLCSFNWSKSPEGFKFWNEIYIEKSLLLK